MWHGQYHEKLTVFLTENTAAQAPTVRTFYINKKKKLYKKGATTMNKTPKGSLKPEEGSRTKDLLALFAESFEQFRQRQPIRP